MEVDDGEDRVLPVAQNNTDNAGMWSIPYKIAEKLFTSNKYGLLHCTLVLHCGTPQALYKTSLDNISQYSLIPCVLVNSIVTML